MHLHHILFSLSDYMFTLNSWKLKVTIIIKSLGSVSWLQSVFVLCINLVMLLAAQLQGIKNHIGMSWNQELKEF